MSLDGKYAIVLDRWIGEYDDHWPVTALFESRDEARAMGSYAGGNPSPLPRSSWDAPTEEPVRLLNESTGDTEEGYIRRLESRTDG